MSSSLPIQLLKDLWHFTFLHPVFIIIPYDGFHLQQQEGQKYQCPVVAKWVAQTELFTPADQLYKNSHWQSDR